MVVQRKMKLFGHYFILLYFLFDIEESVALATKIVAMNAAN